MSPKAFIEARQQAQQEAKQERNGQPTTSIRFEIDGKPYFPLMMATDEESMKEIVFEVFNIRTKEDNNLIIIKEDLVVTPVIGGNTNKLYCISNIPSSLSSSSSSKQQQQQHDVPPSKVLLRIFGGEEVIDRDVETSTYAALAQQKIALSYYGRFGNGRLEEWCDTMKTMNDDDMSKPLYSKAIANEMAKLHTQFQIPIHLKEYHDVVAGKPTMWMQLEDWFNTASQITSFQTIEDTKRANDIQILKLQNELDWLSTEVIPNNKEPSSSSSSKKIGFCHNDVLASNILCSNSSSNNSSSDNNDDSSIKIQLQLQLLDFEYGGINYYGYDIANHFNEFAGGTDADSFATPDYTKFPTIEIQRRFVTEYIKAAKSKMINKNQKQSSTCSSTSGTDPSDDPDVQQQTAGAETDNGNTDDDDDDCYNIEHEVDELLYEIQGFILANHLVWSLWGINQASSEGCKDFDYLHYADCRLKRYYEVKEEYLKSLSPSPSSS